MDNGNQQKRPNATRRAFSEYFKPSLTKTSSGAVDYIPRPMKSPIIAREERETTIRGGGELNLLKNKTPLFPRAKGGPVSPGRSLMKMKGSALSGFMPEAKKLKKGSK